MGEWGDELFSLQIKCNSFPLKSVMREIITDSKFMFILFDPEMWCILCIIPTHLLYYDHNVLVILARYIWKWLCFKNDFWLVVKILLMAIKDYWMTFEIFHKHHVGIIKAGPPDLRANITTITNRDSFKIKGTQVICSLLKVSFNVILGSTVKILPHQQSASGRWSCWGDYRIRRGALS